MENLNDVEFGSDKNEEEAPILVAQRYLNIFRQIHIFSKEKRDQFDDELLALPQNILDFYKRMPGGRLLIEHIEDVKTERGISFVKANKDDFSYDTSSSTGGSGGGGGVPAPVVGGNLVMDNSFAETLAQSMAAAFKGVPAAAAPIATGATSNVAVSADFGNAFDIIAEEIRTSRASLLDVLKETRNITDTVIASQVSISRVLESLLSSKNRDETDVANLNNKIIASQASITKLLEGLYSANAIKNEEISNYLNIDNKLQDFRNDLTQTIMGSLSGFADRSSVATAGGEGVSFDVESRLAAFKNEVKADVNKSLTEIKSLLANLVEDGNKHFSATDLNDNLPITDDNSSEVSSNNSSDEFSNVQDNEISDTFEKKKKKKKKKKNLEAAAIAPIVEEATAVTAAHAEASMAEEDRVPFIEDDNAQSIEDTVQNVDASDELSDILSDLGNVDLNLSDEISGEPKKEDALIDSMSQTDDLEQISDVVISDENASPLTEDSPSTGDISVDNLDDFLNEGPSTDESVLEQPNESQEISDQSDLDNFLDNDNLSASQEESSDLAQPKFSNLDDFSADDDLDFALPEQNTDHISDNTSDTGPNASASDDDLDFALPEVSEDSEQPLSDEKEDTSSLDEVANIDESQENSLVDEEASALASDETASPRSSRYSAELDKIREALTSDKVDLASLDEPIALDDYSDDENVSEEDDEVSVQKASSSATDASSSDEDWEYEYVEDDGKDASDTTSHQAQSQEAENSGDGDWEWEYVDENGNPAPVEGSSADEDWEWEYVEDDGNENSETSVEDNNNKE